jgi:hypothetical protein
MRAVGPAQRRASMGEAVERASLARPWLAGRTMGIDSTLTALFCALQKTSGHRALDVSRGGHHDVPPLTTASQARHAPRPAPSCVPYHPGRFAQWAVKISVSGYAGPGITEPCG